ncbi:MAG: DUF3048 C-terminal domain-containing protein [Chloroflexi bacterium]|nr:DUF3048 C-terminal domain-containing protein [Chloroflexota bacterium]MBI3741042.1 DUF3048 C-terminal domain-containing protein [Chloroflexota bacterium]
MFSLFKRLTPIFLICLALIVVSCAPQEIEPTPAPTLRPTRTPIPTEEPTETPFATEAPSTPTPIIATPRAQTNAVPAPQIPGTDPLIPIFGSFPPLAIPARPANINPITGLAADPAALLRRPVLIRIGNDQRVREDFWQAGTNSADLVFEELIDQIGSAYANTRYTAVFLTNDAPLVGPIRSGRLINLQLAPMFDGSMAHAGASNGTRWIFSQTPMINFDEFFNMPAYCYINSHGYQGRLYTTVARQRQWLVQKGLEKPVPLYGFQFSAAPTGNQLVKSVGLTKAPWPKWTAVEWKYDASKQKYMRGVTGAPLMDNSYSVTAKWGNGASCTPQSAESRTQVSATNVIVLYAKHERTSIVEDSNNAFSVYINLVGQGDLDIFRDGVRIHGKWMRNSVQEFFELIDDAGHVIPLKPGNSWVEIVPTGYSLDLK